MHLFTRSYSEEMDRTYHFPTFSVRLTSHMWFDVGLFCDCRSPLLKECVQFRILTRLFLQLQRVKTFLRLPQSQVHLLSPDFGIKADLF